MVASEITRRLMPGYLPDLAVAQERERQAAEAFQARARAAELICAALPGKEMPTADPKHHRFPRINLPYGQVTGHIDIHYNGDSELELHNIPPATVVRILELIRASKPA